MDYYKVAKGKLLFLFLDPLEFLAIAMDHKSLSFKNLEWLKRV